MYRRHKIRHEDLLMTMKHTVLSGLGDLHEDDAKRSDDINIQAACYAL